MQRTDATSIRHRRLPAEQVVWLMVALALYRDKSISEVLDDLDLVVPVTRSYGKLPDSMKHLRERLVRHSE